MSELHELFSDKFKIGNDLLNNLNNFKNVNGVDKLQRKVKKELDFLSKKTKDGSLKIEHLHCTNLNHFSAIYEAIITLKDVTAIDHAFLHQNQKLYIDIVMDFVWIKVIARNPKSLQQVANGDSGYGTRSILDHADCYIECAKQHPIRYKIPKILFHFSQNVTEELQQQLEELGIIVTNNENLKSVMNEIQLENHEIQKLNLDISTMIAYISNLTNGYCDFVYPEPLLTQQAQWERERPVKPILDELFKNKELYCCQTAADSLNTILETVGGKMEKVRAGELLKRVQVLPDEGENRFLEVCGKVKERSRLIFEFGEKIQAVTVTANDGFVRAAKRQGVEFTTFVHESRALTEQKESKAIGDILR